MSKYLCYNPDETDSSCGVEITADNEKEAALKFAKHHDSDPRNDYMNERYSDGTACNVDVIDACGRRHEVVI